MNNPTNHVQVSDIRNWLSAFLERQNVTDVEIAITGTSYRGTGYLSDITYVDLTHKKSKDKLYRFAIKSSKPILKEVLPLRNMNLNEMLFYTFLPALNRILLQLDTGLIFHNVPKFYESVVDPEKEIMVLQDMRREGYHMFNRRLHLNEVHLKRVMAVYAKLHAVTLAFQIRRDYFFQSFCSHLRDTVGEIKTQELLKEQEFLADLEAMARNEERTAVANYLHKLLKWTNYTTATDDISVVIHGDATICNFLFKYETSEERKTIADVCLLDFQHCRLGSPVIDLACLIYSCMSPQHCSEIDDFVAIYYYVLVDFLIDMRVDVVEHFSFEHFEEHWFKYGPIGIRAAILYLKNALMDDDQIIDLEEAVSTNTSCAYTEEVVRRCYDRIWPLLQMSLDKQII